MADNTRSDDATPSNNTFTVPLLICGKEERPVASFEIVDPSTGKPVHRCSSASPADAARAVDAAVKAFPVWKAETPRGRRDLFLRVADILYRRREELADYMKHETGAASDWIDFNLKKAREMLVDIAGRISRVEGTVPTVQDVNRGALVLKEPYGVVLSIAPWNAPYVLGIRAIALPLAAGNTVVLKGSELSPRVMWAICSVFAEAGLPPGALNLVVSQRSDAAAVTESLIAHQAVKKINFTGSTQVGRVVARVAGENLKPVLLELGGKAPAIVWDDADLELAAQHCVAGSFINSGQVCMSTERIIVHQRVADAFEDKLCAAIGKYFPNGKTDGMVLIQERAVQKAKTLVQDALSKGARIISGGVSLNMSPTRLWPTILTGVTADMEIYNTETFAPVVCLFKIRTEEEALRIANDTEYGLSSAVFTEDLRRGLRFARAIETGAVHINNMTVHDETALPHGGTKASGYGRFNGPAIEEWVRSKTVTYQL